MICKFTKIFGVNAFISNRLKFLKKKYKISFMRKREGKNILFHIVYQINHVKTKII